MLSYKQSCKLLSCCLCLLLFTACSSVAATPTNTPPTTQSTKTATTTVSYSCQVSRTPIGQAQIGGPEVRGVSSNAELWALIQSTSGVPPVAGTYVKIVWHMTGSGTFSLFALGPGNKTLQPEQGPEAHNGSNWDRPGGEWGSGFTFLNSGCWQLHATLGSGSGDIWLTIIK